MDKALVSRIGWFAKHAALTYLGAVVGAVACVGLGLTGYAFSPSLVWAFWAPCAIVLACAALVAIRYHRVRGLGVGAFGGTAVWMAAFLNAAA